MDQKLALEAAEALSGMVAAFKPFTSKPIGAPGSIARAEQEQQVIAHKKAMAVLNKLDAMVS